MVPQFSTTMGPAQLENAAASQVGDRILGVNGTRGASHAILDLIKDSEEAGSRLEEDRGGHETQFAYIDIYMYIFI